MKTSNTISGKSVNQKCYAIVKARKKLHKICGIRFVVNDFGNLLVMQSQPKRSCLPSCQKTSGFLLGEIYFVLKFFKKKHVPLTCRQQCVHG